MQDSNPPLESEQAFPEAVVINMIRQPYYTIGSWKRTFAHLREARVDGPFLHGMNSSVIGI